MGGLVSTAISCTDCILIARGIAEPGDAKLEVRADGKGTCVGNGEAMSGCQRSGMADALT